MMAAKRTSVANAAGHLSLATGEGAFFAKPTPPADEPEAEREETRPPAPALEAVPAPEDDDDAGPLVNLGDFPELGEGATGSAEQPAPEPPLDGPAPDLRRTRERSADRPARRPAPAPKSEELVACQVYVPAEVLQRAWGLLRPNATGGRRGVAKTLLIGAYVRAIHNLDLNIDTTGLESGMDDEATRRVEAALHELMSS